MTLCKNHKYAIFIKNEYTVKVPEGTASPAPVKREAGENPARTRHRNKGAEADISLGNREDGPSVDL